MPRGLLGGFAGELADAAITRVLGFLLSVLAILLDVVIIAIRSLGSCAIVAPPGVVSARRRRSWIARGVTGYNALAMAVRTFWLGILLEIRAVLGSGRGGDDDGR